MLIPQAAGAYDIALSLTDSLYDTRRYRMKVSIPYSAVDAIHPGTVLIAAIAELALALRSNPSGKAPFEPDRMRALSDWLGGYCELQPLGRDIRRAAPHQMYTLIQQLLTYYA
ncbi:hypothetical protein M9979_02990 [Sphingomonas sp. RP10(2022)]|uniref:Uncharacterized protein n=1 Tax=Sphingomonas liriopis TaxID=2949094 RepID=A0A9X2KSI9_9SPHN|nr:hypothetical protein [Sphingomonas liriopis]MCP3733843.1 hypothetical protein [Sphingomonas liriopis]